jgi:hypothetical protein
LFRREALEARLAELESGHDAIARKLQFKAQALGGLPREMRDAIYEQLYRSKTPVLPEMLRFGPKTLFKMPTDSALYMSQRHVGPVIAEEAAEIFYTQNTFGFGGGRTVQSTLQWCRDKYDLFLDSDHYESGVRPRDLIRKLHVVLSSAGRSSYASALRFEYNARSDDPRQITFERKFHEWVDRSESSGTQYFDDREHLGYFLDFDGLQELTIDICASDGEIDSICRLINPIIRQLKDRRVKVTVISYRTTWENGDANSKPHEQDVSSFFDAPSFEDYALFKKQHPVPLFAFDPMSDPLESWWTLTKTADWDIIDSIYEVGFSLDCDDPGLVRVWLHEAYEVFKFYQKHRVVVDKLNEMWDELKSFTPQEVAVRKLYYGRMMELMTRQG